ncbi:hypothetical protein BDZ89DRAFT_1048712 [Hymenopellis radicata]|nr:hypothetical protein BDZ89DRAFT_1048712 [Hymenopellis radicata]
MPPRHSRRSVSSPSLSDLPKRKHAETVGKSSKPPTKRPRSSSRGGKKASGGRGKKKQPDPSESEAESEVAGVEVEVVEDTIELVSEGVSEGVSEMPSDDEEGEDSRGFWDKRLKKLVARWSSECYTHFSAPAVEWVENAGENGEYQQVFVCKLRPDLVVHRGFTDKSTSNLSLEVSDAVKLTQDTVYTCMHSQVNFKSTSGN